MSITDFLVPSDCGACGHYRIIRPGKFQADLFNHTPMQWMLKASYADWQRYQIGKVIFNRAMSNESLRYWTGLRKVLAGVPFILDFDDALWAAHPRSTYAPTRAMLKNMDAIVGLSDIIVASTPYLRDELEQRYRGRPVRLMPNLLFDAEFNRHPTKRQPGEKLRVLWSGSDTHIPDLEQIIPVVQSTHDRYHWIFKGYVPPILQNLVEYHPPTPTLTYLADLHSLKAHVGIAPLVDNLFNRCKSNLKVLEYSALGLASIASYVEPYKSTPALEVRKPRARDWVNALRVLEDETTRAQSVEIAQKWARIHSFDNPLQTPVVKGVYAC